jgi:hypothetical protein
VTDWQSALRSELTRRGQADTFPLNLSFCDLAPGVKVRAWPGKPGPLLGSAHLGMRVFVCVCVCLCVCQVELLHALCEWQLEDTDQFRMRLADANVDEDESWVREQAGLPAALDGAWALTQAAHAAAGRAAGSGL